MVMMVDGDNVLWVMVGMLITFWGRNIGGFGGRNVFWGRNVFG